MIHVLSKGIGKGLLIKLTRDRTRDLTFDEFERIRPWFVYHHGGWAVIRVRHRGVGDMVRLLQSMDGVDLKEGKLSLHIVGVSGTLRSAFYKYISKRSGNGHHYREDREGAQKRKT